MSLDLIFKAIADGRCLPFLGAGASAGYFKNGQEIPGIPTGGSLAELLAQTSKYRNGPTYDLARVAEYVVYTNSGQRDELETVVAREISRVSEPRPIHTVLAQIEKIHFVITSNYDQLLEFEAGKYRRQLRKHYHDLQNPKTGHFKANVFGLDPSELILHKMHGTVENPRSMVITQSDYIRYLANLNDSDRGMPELFRRMVIPNFVLLFLGYGLEDWNFRVIWEGVLAQYHDAGTQIQSYAVMRKPSDFQVAFWRGRRIDVLDYDLTDFAARLARRFDLEVPQLGIQRGPAP
jgi:hypothetical protein